MCSTDESIDEFKRGKSIALKSGVFFLEMDDDYVHLNPDVEYLVENDLFEPDSMDIYRTDEYKNLDKTFQSFINNSCNCSKDCTEPCRHSKNYKIHTNNDGTKELVLNENRLSRDLIYECSIHCKCLTTCRNRLLQFGPRKNLKIIPSKNLNNQYGLITTKAIPKGGFVCEYAGEILTKSEAKQRSNLCQEKRNSCNNMIMNYIICLNEYSLNKAEINEHQDVQSNPIQTFIDPSKRGNIGRYLNHSCEPNCEIISIRIDDPIPKLGIFTKRNITPFEELTFHYGGEKLNNCRTNENNRIKCLCGAENCEKFLPNFDF